MKQNYQEGSWFAVPLRGGGFGMGVVARAVVGKPIIICYLFGPCRESVPTLADASKLFASSAILVLRVGDLGLRRGTWPIIGTVGSWRRSDWPMPIFIRREVFPPFRIWRVFYSESDPSETVKEELSPNDGSGQPEDVLSGSGAAEIKLTLMIEGPERSKNPRHHSAPRRTEPAKPSAPFNSDSFHAEVLRQLKEFGSDTSKPHSFDFFLYFPSETAALQAAERMRESSFTVKVMPSSNSKKWLCQVKRVLVPESGSFDEMKIFFEQIAASLHGEFDGWESDVVKS